MFFDFGRKEGFPTQYPAHQTPVTVDILEAGVICAFLILYVCFLLVIPNRNGKVFRSAFIRTTISLLIGLFIILGNIGQEWEVGHAFSRMPYRVGTHKEINASIGLKIGLRSINVTLKSAPEQNNLPKEIIDYNERFSWEWDQGRFGFGPYAGRIQREFREGQRIGLPLPILWIVDYFVIDGEGFRFGRFYRTAGWYAHIAMWTAFPCWILANILFLSVIQYGAIFLAITGGLLLLSNLLWIVIRNPLALEIPFEYDVLTTKLGVSFWLTFVTGITCLVIALIITILNRTHDKELYLFFGVDNLNDYYEFYDNGQETAEKDEDVPAPELRQAIRMSSLRGESVDEEYNPIVVNPRPHYIRRSVYKRKPKAAQPKLEEDPIYENLIKDAHLV